MLIIITFNWNLHYFGFSYTSFRLLFCQCSVNIFYLLLMPFFHRKAMATVYCFILWAYLRFIWNSFTCIFWIKYGLGVTYEAWSVQAISAILVRLKSTVWAGKRKLRLFWPPWLCRQKDMRCWFKSSHLKQSAYLHDVSLSTSAFKKQLCFICFICCRPLHIWDKMKARCDSKRWLWWW